MLDSDNKRSTFIVEPDPVVSSTLKTILANHGYEAEVFNDPIEGLSSVLAKKPNLVIAAVVMSRLTGIELAIQVKHHCPGCKVLLWSAVPEAAALNAEAQAIGHHFEILPKPVHPRDLLNKISELFFALPA